MSTSHENILIFFIVSRWILLKMRTVSDKSCRENQNTHFMSSNYFFPWNRAVYEIMWKNIVESDRPQMAIRRTRCAWWISDATDTHVGISYCSPKETMFTRTLRNVTLHLKFMCCYLQHKQVDSAIVMWHGNSLSRLPWNHAVNRQHFVWFSYSILKLREEDEASDTFSKAGSGFVGKGSYPSVWTIHEKCRCSGEH